jgi:hypothetical protein
MCSADRYSKLYSKDINIGVYIGIRAETVPVCIRYIGTLGGCGHHGCCQVYDCVCRAEGFGLLLAEICDHNATLPLPNKNIL